MALKDKIVALRSIHDGWTHEHAASLKKLAAQHSHVTDKHDDAVKVLNSQDNAHVEHVDSVGHRGFAVVVGHRIRCSHRFFVGHGREFA